MYKPAPVRSKKTDICRSRTGCKGCRQRRKKCDEQKPSCGSCMKLGKVCERVTPKFEFRSVSSPSRNSHRHSTKRGPESVSGYSSLADDTSEQRDDGSVSYFPLDWDLSQSCTMSLDGGSSSLRHHAQSSLPVFQSDNDPFPMLGPWEGPGGGLQIDPVWPLTSHTQPRVWEICSGSLAHSKQLDSECNNEETPVHLPATLLPRGDANHAVIFYMDAWRDQCLPALHPSFHHVEALCGQSSLITNIMVTLSACRLSRTLPQRRPFKIFDTPGLCFRPDSGHECFSGELYGSALRKMACWDRQKFDSHPILGLAVLVLFCYLESSMGNFQEFRLHSDGVEKLLKSYPDRVIPHGAGLLAAWLEVKMQNWWRRAYFSTPDLYRNYSVPYLPGLEAVSTLGTDWRAAVLRILCESHHINTAAIVECWDRRKVNSQNTEAGIVSDLGGPIEAGNSERRLSRSRYLTLLQAQSVKLDAWYASLPVCDLPKFMENQEDQRARLNDDLQVEAIYFRSHNCAMNFAYYVAARVVQCTDPLQTLEMASLSHIERMYDETENWVLMLLRIAAGINWKDCIRLNVYTIGMTGLLLACALRSRSLATGVWIQEWLEDHLKGDEFEEGNFPVFQILDAVRLINHERENGRDVLSLFQTVDDDGGRGKFGSYHSQLISSLLIYGRCRTTGEMYTYSASV